MEEYPEILVIVEDKKQYKKVLNDDEKPDKMAIVSASMPYPALDRLDMVIVYGSCSIARDIYSVWVKDYTSYYGQDEDEPGYGRKIIIIDDIRLLISRYFRKNRDCDEIISRVEADQVWQPPKHSLKSFSDISKTKIKQNKFIDGLCDQRGGLLLAGAAGAGKSCLVNFIAHHVACGEQQLFNKFGIEKPGSVLIIQSENSYQANAKRLELLYQARPDLASSANKVFILNNFSDESNIQITAKINDVGFQEEIKNYAKEINAAMIVLDPWGSFNPGSENSNESVRQLLESFQANVCFPTNATLMLVHHLGNSGQVRGASSLRDWAETTLIMEPVNHESVIKMTHSKCRNYLKQPPFYLNLTSNLDFIPVDQPGTKIGSQVKIVIDCLEELGGAAESQATLKEKVMGKLDCSEKYARKLINRACDEGFILQAQGHQNSYKIM